MTNVLKLLLKKRLQQLLQVKRDRTHATTVNDHDECDKKSSDDWDLADYRREFTHIQNHLSVPLGSRAEVPTGTRFVHWCTGVGMVVCRVVTCWM